MEKRLRQLIDNNLEKNMDCENMKIGEQFYYTRMIIFAV